MEEGTILCWRKNEGEYVKKGEILLEIETDKANVEVEAVDSGILHKILCPEGMTVPVLTPIAVLAGPEEIAGEPAQAGAESRSMTGERTPTRPVEQEAGSEQSPVMSAAFPVPSTEQPDDHTLRSSIKVSPAARKSAQEQGVDLSTIGPGSGPGGRILSTDLPRAVKDSPAASTAEPIRRPLSGMRKAIARNLVASKQNIPHFYVRLTIDAAPLDAFCRARKVEHPCSINDVLTAACARAMHEFPAFRTRIENDELVEYPDANIGVAVGMEEGLRVPVLMRADRLSLRQVAEATRRIIEAAKQGRVEAMGKGVLTISNLGMYGIEEFAAIINPPESALLAVGAIREAVIVKGGAIRAGRVMTITLSADHRVIDGLLAARFLNRLREVLEAPESLSQ